MNLSRRQIFGGALAAPVILNFSVLPTAAAIHGAPKTQVIALQRIRAGEAVVTAISDGFLQLDVAYLSNITPEEANKVLASEFMKASPVTTGCNAYLVSAKGRTVLIDTGGAGYMPNLGKLVPGLKASGVSPGDIDAVLMTHLHVDHIGGLVTAGKATFPNAELHVHENDVAYFTSAKHRSETPEPFKVGFDKAKEALAAYSGKLRTFKGNIEVLPGISSYELFGHTPGHSGYVVGSGDDALFIWGDIVHVGPVQMAKPDVGVAFDVDGPRAVTTRKAVLAKVAADRMRIAGMHIAFPGIGYVKALESGKGYDFEPASWTYALD